MLAAVIDRALRAHGHETARLRFLPENRYNRKMFPSQGRYDWFSGQVLYCLVRYLRPQQVVEIACAEGYSSLFMALALRENGTGVLETFELSPRRARRAWENFQVRGVADCVRLHIGDVRQRVAELALEKTDLLFLDSLLSDSATPWSLEALVPRLAGGVPVHIHDLLPRYARVRHFAGPPFPAAWSVGWLYRAARRLFRPGGFASAPLFPEAVPLDGERPGGEKNRSAEGQVLNGLVEWLAADEYVYLYDLPDRYPHLGPRDYDARALGRQDAHHHPLEWNESLWVYAGPLRAAYAQVGLTPSLPAEAIPAERHA